MSTLVRAMARMATAAGAAAVRSARAGYVLQQAFEAGSVSAVPPVGPTIICKTSRALRRRAQLQDRGLYPLGGDAAIAASSTAYPTVNLEVPWGYPVEVTLLGELPLGTGNALFAEATVRQARHATYEDEHNEESARIGATSIGVQKEGAREAAWSDNSGCAKIGEKSDGIPDDVTAVYTFSVGGHGHPFHRHEGHRCFTAISGSSGCRLGFSSATVDQVSTDPLAFIDQLSFVDIPADGLFTVRFNGGVWHRFMPLRSPDPAFFAISVHPDETGGDLTDDIKQQVENNESSIGLLTQRLPDEVESLLSKPEEIAKIPIYRLELSDPR